MQITINNWERFNPRSDVKKSSWFRMDHSIFSHPNFIEFTHTDIISWLYILSLASQLNSNSISISSEHLRKIGKIKSNSFTRACNKLKALGCISFDVTDAAHARDVDDTCTVRARLSTNERTNDTEPQIQKKHVSVPNGTRDSHWLVNLWNENRGSLSKVKEISKKRFRLIKSRLEDCDDQETWLAAIKRIAASEFCSGRMPGKTWKADFDFLLQPDTRIKALEGKYDNHGSPKEKLTLKTELPDD